MFKWASNSYTPQIFAISLYRALKDVSLRSGNCSLSYAHGYHDVIIQLVKMCNIDSQVESKRRAIVWYPLTYSFEYHLAQIFQCLHPLRFTGGTVRQISESESFNLLNLAYSMYTWKLNTIKKIGFNPIEGRRKSNQFGFWWECFAAEG